MVRRIHFALAAAAVCGGLSAPALAGMGGPPRLARAGEQGPHAEWPRDPQLERTLGFRRGAIVAVDPRDGRVLAFAGGREKLREAAPPGSLAKILTAYAALRAGKTDATRRIVCKGSFQGRTCARAHGALTLDAALAQSCNVHFAVLGTEVGAGPLLAAARDFGFGAATGADPAESPGRVATPVGAGGVADLAYGVGPSLTATPLQIVRALAAIGNGGDVLALHVDRAARKVVRTLDPAPLGLLRAGLRGATRKPGTAQALSALGFGVAGKTGTAIFVEGDPPRWYAHFAGFAPAAAPTVAIAVRTEGRSAAHDAVPVAAKALRELLPSVGTVRPSAHVARHVRVWLFAAHEITALTLRGNFDMERRGGRRRVSGTVRLVATEPGTTLVRPAPGNVVTLIPTAATRRGRTDLPTARVLWSPVTIRSDKGQLVAVADVPQDTYAAGVAIAELGAWPAPRSAALAAQAIVARTYALKHRDRHLGEGADMCDLTHCQLYTGDHSVPVAGRRALAASAGVVLESAGEPIDALYHAACGGRREANEDVFGGPALAYLRGGPDAWCARDAGGSAWRAHVTWGQLTRALAGDVDLGTLRDLRVARRTADGLPAEIELIGERGSVTVVAYQFWRDLGAALGWNVVRSVRFQTVPTEDGVDFVGRGLGHAVGLCQAGAKARAAEGATPAEVLAAYYPGTELRRLAGGMNR